jgi:DNA-directed RNA polymerase specialized sigma24 family protein
MVLTSPVETSFSVLHLRVSFLPNTLKSTKNQACDDVCLVFCCSYLPLHSYFTPTIQVQSWSSFIVFTFEDLVQCEKSGKTSLKAFLVTAALNSASDYTRNAYQRRVISYHQTSLEADDAFINFFIDSGAENEIGYALDRVQMGKISQILINMYAPDTRKALYMLTILSYRLAGWQWEEISRELDMKQATVKTHWERNKLQIYTQLKQAGILP